MSDNKMSVAFIGIFCLNGLIHKLPTPVNSSTILPAWFIILS